MANVREIAVSGGDTTGLTAGDAGSIVLEAPVGTIRVVNFDIEARGGFCTFLEGGTAGAGGRVTFSSDSIDIQNVTVNTNGGDAVGDPTRDREEFQGNSGGIGGAAGAVNLASVSGLDVDVRGVILAKGGAATWGTCRGEMAAWSR